MFQTILTAGPFLAGTAALLALILNLTRGTRLNHRERVLRESMAVLEANSPHRTTVAELHLQIVAEIVARQASGKWRFWWPWLVLLAFAAAMAQIGYEATTYFERGGAFDYWKFAAEVGDPGALVFPFFFVIGSPLVVGSYRHSIFERANIALDFYNRGILRQPEAYFNALDDRYEGRRSSAQTTAGQLKRVGLGVLVFVKSAAPGVAAAAVGILSGIGLSLRQFPLDERARVLSAMGAVPAITVLLASLSISITLLALTDGRVAFLNQFPSQPHPRKSTVLPGPIDYL